MCFGSSRGYDWQHLRYLFGQIHCCTSTPFPSNNFPTPHILWAKFHGRPEERVTNSLGRSHRKFHKGGDIPAGP